MSDVVVVVGGGGGGGDGGGGDGGGGLSGIWMATLESSVRPVDMLL